MTKMLKRILFAFLVPIACLGQNTIGLPDITNYSKIDYNAGLQNWDFRQDKNGIMYAANNEGLLSFDGKYWKLYPLPNKTIVRSVEIGSDNRIYVGGQDEFGYFDPAANGQLQYHSLVKFVAEKDRDFADVWDIALFKNDIFFRTSRRIFKLTNNNITVYNAPTEWSYVGACNESLYAHDIQKGLMVFEDYVWKPIVSEALMNVEVTAIMPLKGASIIATLKNGIYQYSTAGINKIVTGTTSNIEKDRIYAATVINQQWIGIGTTNGGVYIIDENGDLVQKLSKKEGIENNNILNIFSDNQNNLWLGLNNGIACIGVNNAIKHINPYFQDASGYAAIIHKEKLYVGTSNGLFSVPIQSGTDLSFNRGDFTPIANTTGQVWNLADINDKLLLAHHEGAFIVNNNEAKKIMDGAGYWNFAPISGVLPTAKIIAGNYKGVTYLNEQGNTFSLDKPVGNFTQSSRFVAIDNNENIWVSHPFHGVYKINKGAVAGTEPKLYGEKNGLPSNLNNHVYKIKNEILVATEKGVYNYNEAKDIFEPSAFYKKLLGEQSLRYLKDDKDGNIWFVHDKQLGVVDMTTASPKIIYISELNNKLLSGFELVYPVNENNIFIAGESGLFNLNYKKYKKNNYDLQVHIREVRITGERDSLLFGGYFNNVNEKQVQDKSKIPQIHKNWQTIHFEYSTTLFGLQKNLEYSYRMVGSNNNWSAWSHKTEKEYTNLPPGTYTFEIKVRNNLGGESVVDSYTFKVMPPWYLSQWAYLLYFVLLMMLVYGLILWQNKKFDLQRIRLQEEQEKLNYLKQLEIDKANNKLTEIRNENLQLEISSKNTELINFTMHLVQKGELLSNLKMHMSKMMKELDNAEATDELKKMIKVLNDAEKMDKDWESFTYHFDKAHNSFTEKLKEKYPKLTANELKLCTFLRLNLSTKEIAQLMNISMRGIELSRYRLRKKLNLATETSLFEFFNEI